MKLSRKKKARLLKSRRRSASAVVTKPKSLYNMKKRQRTAHLRKKPMNLSLKGGRRSFFMNVDTSRHGASQSVLAKQDKQANKYGFLKSDYTKIHRDDWKLKEILYDIFGSANTNNQIKKDFYNLFYNNFGITINEYFKKKDIDNKKDIGFQHSPNYDQEIQQEKSPFKFPPVYNVRTDEKAYNEYDLKQFRPWFNRIASSIHKRSLIPKIIHNLEKSLDLYFTESPSEFQQDTSVQVSPYELQEDKPGEEVPVDLNEDIPDEDIPGQMSPGEKQQSEVPKVSPGEVPKKSPYLSSRPF